MHQRDDSPVSIQLFPWPQRIAAAVIAVLAFLPLGARGTVGVGWIPGTVVVLAVAALAVLLTRNAPNAWRAPAARALREWYDARPRSAATILAVLAFAMYVVVAWMVFDAAPLNIDELAQVVQARIFRSGHLWLPASPHPEFFSAYHIVDVGGKVYSQFPAGGPLLLALGELTGAPWIVMPLCGAIAVAAFGWYLRAAEPRPGVALGALLLFALSPFTAFMSGSYMNHMSTLMWLLIALAALAHLTRSRAAAGSRLGLAFVCGLGFGCAATIRPTDALAFALPAGAWLLARAVRYRRWSDVVVAGAGVAIPLALLMWVNAQTTGAPLRFGYEVLWGAAHGLGFHRDPAGDVHSVARGIGYLNLYFARFQTHLFETPVPSLAAAITALALVPRLGSLDRFWLASAAILLALYGAYWFAGDYLGPRFLFPLAPLFALWTARLPAIVRERWGPGTAYRATLATYAAAAVGALVFGVPARVREYRAIAPLQRWDAGRAAVDAGARGAIVFVRENWGGQIVARLWALGLTRSDASYLYRRVDSCVLEDHLDAVERSGARNDAAYRALAPLMADSARLIASPYSPRTNERALPGLDYSPRCRDRIAENQAGFLPYQPFIIARGGGNLFARDMGARDTLLLAEHPSAPVFAVRLDLTPNGRGLFVERVRRDSIVGSAHTEPR